MVQWRITALRITSSTSILDCVNTSSASDKCSVGGVWARVRRYDRFCEDAREVADVNPTVWRGPVRATGAASYVAGDFLVLLVPWAVPFPADYLRTRTKQYICEYIKRYRGHVAPCRSREDRASRYQKCIKTVHGAASDLNFRRENMTPSGRWCTA